MYLYIRTRILRHRKWFTFLESIGKEERAPNNYDTVMTHLFDLIMSSQLPRIFVLFVKFRVHVALRNVALFLLLNSIMLIGKDLIRTEYLQLSVKKPSV